MKLVFASNVAAVVQLLIVLCPALAPYSQVCASARVQPTPGDETLFSSERVWNYVLLVRGIPCMLQHNLYSASARHLRIHARAVPRKAGMHGIIPLKTARVRRYTCLRSCADVDVRFLIACAFFRVLPTVGACPGALTRLSFVITGKFLECELVSTVVASLRRYQSTTGRGREPGRRSWGHQGR
jgi:hypothetical protein